MADTPTYVFSHDPAAAKPVATQVREFGSVGSTAAFQITLLADASSNTLASVRSYATTNPLAVALTDATGGHVTTLPVTGSLVTSIAGQVTVAGSVTATQGGAPWEWVGSATVTGSVGALVTGTVVSSVIGQPTVTASITGNVPVTQVTSPWGVQVGSVAFTVPQGAVVGSVVAAQGGAPWTAQLVDSAGAAVIRFEDSPHATADPGVMALAVVKTNLGTVLSNDGDYTPLQTNLQGQLHTAPVSAWLANTPTVSVLQVTSPWVTQPGSTGAFMGFVVASIVGGGSTVTGSVWVSQASSPWATQLTSGGQFIGYTVTSIVGGGSSITGSVWLANTPTVHALQVTSPWVTQAGSTGAFAGFVVASIVGGGSTVTGSVWASQASSPWVSQIASGGQFIGFTVTSIVDGGLSITGSVWVVNTVSVAQGTSPWVVVGSVQVTQQTSPWITQPGSIAYTVPQGAVVASLTGQPTVTASVVGHLTATASVTGQVTVTASVAGSVPVTQTTSPWVTQAASIAYTVPQGAMVGSVTATQGGAPWTTNASVSGQLTVTASVVGAVAVTQTTSPWIVQAGSTGAFTGFVVASIVGGAMVSVTNTPTLNALQAGSWGVLISGGGTGLPAGVSSYGGDGHLLRVDLVRGTLSAGADGALIDGADSTIRATVTSGTTGNTLLTRVTSIDGPALAVTLRVIDTSTVAIQHQMLVDGAADIRASVYSYGGGKPLAVALTNLTGSHYVTVPVTGTLVASITGTVVASVVGAVQPYGSPSEAFFAVSTTSTITTSERLLLAAAPGASVRYYVTTLLVTVASVGTMVDVLDGTTPMWRGYAAANGGGFAVHFPMPLRQPTTNTSLGVQFVTSGAAGFVSVAGFTGA